jgi:hypothetical protein
MFVATGELEVFSICKRTISAHVYRGESGLSTLKEDKKANASSNQKAPEP